MIKWIIIIGGNASKSEMGSTEVLFESTDNNSLLLIKPPTRKGKGLITMNDLSFLTLILWFIFPNCFE